MSADDSKPTVGGRSRRLEQNDGYSEAFQEGIAEANFFVQQGLYDEAIGVLEELQRTYGADPRILGRLHVARSKMRQAPETTAEQKPAPVQSKQTPPPAKPKLTPPPAKPKPVPLASVSGPPSPVKTPHDPVLDIVEPAPMPDFEERTSNAITNPITIPIPLDLESASVVEAKPVPFDEPVVLPESAPPTPAPPLPDLPATLDGSPLSPFEPKRTALVPERIPRSPRRSKMLLALGGAVVLIAVLVIVPIVALKGVPDDKSGKAGDAQTVSSGGDSMQRTGPRRTPPPRRVAAEEPGDSMSAMARGTATGGDNPDMAPDTATGGDNPDKRKVRLLLTIEPKRANAVIHFRGGKYLTNRFVSKKVKSRSAEEVITIAARGYVKMELKLTLDQDLERTVKLKRKTRRMKLFDIGSK